MAVITRMSSVQILPLGNYNNGAQTSSAIDVASDVTSILFSIQRCTTATPTIWPNVSTTLEILPEVSTDGGVTWNEAGRSTNVGGISFFRGNEVAFAASGGSLPTQVGATPRKYRVTTTIAGGPLRTSATAEIT